MVYDAGPIARVGRLAAHEEPVTSVPFVDGARADALARLGIRTVGELLAHYPFRYIDLTKVCRIRDVTPGVDVTVMGRVREIHVKQPRPRLTIVEVAITDGHGGMLVGVWFNQPYMAQRFVEGERVAFAGTPKFEFGLTQIRNPFVEKLGTEDDGQGLSRILPIHHCTEGLSTNWMRRLIAGALESYGDVPDYLPATLRASHDLLSSRQALRAIHFPDDDQVRADARRRLAYDELFCLQLGMVMRRHRLTVERQGVAHSADGPALRSLRADLPFALTDEQLTAVDEILADMSAPHP
ncbi:MAG: ATP-dependent DNA helicase RecG, partial [Coriobacteriia bacterium]|nr:ATP-dependent DNA helicase RecG [Coriobacteriia bacterium]